MTITSVGYAGTVNDAQWAGMTHLLGAEYCVDVPASVRPTQVAATRTVRFATGSIFGRGIKDTLGATEDVTPATPTNGQWYLIVMRRTWATKVSVPVAIASTTTSTSTPAAGSQPSSYPSMNTTPGTVDDQPLCWVWINSANTTMVIVDLRTVSLPGRTYKTQALLPAANTLPVIGEAYYVSAIPGAKFFTDGTVWQMDGTPRFATSAARDAAITTPLTGMVTRLDTDLFPRRYNGTAWRPFGAGKFPIKPTGVSGTGVALGADGRVTFTTATAVSVDGCFTADFDNYLIVIEIPTMSGAANLLLRLRAAGTDLTTSTYSYGGTANNATTTAVGSSGAATGFYLSRDPLGMTSGGGDAEVFAPALTRAKRVAAKMATANASYASASTVSGLQPSTASHDGFTLTNDTGPASMTGTLRIYGYNNN